MSFSSIWLGMLGKEITLEIGKDIAACDKNEVRF